MKLPIKNTFTLNNVFTVFAAVAFSYFFYGLHLFLANTVFFISQQWQLKNYFLLSLYVVWSVAILKLLDTIWQNIAKTHPDDKEVQNHLIPFLKATSKIVIVLIITALSLNDWNVNLAPLLASAGVAGVAIAFAAKDIVANFFGGISIFFDKPYKVGDFVIIDEKYRGEVIQIGMRSTKIKTRDEILITIPNSVMTTNAVINETGLDPVLRLRIPVQVSYRSNLASVEQIILEVIGKHKSVLKEPPIKVRYRGFEESGVGLEALANIDEPANRGLIVHELIKAIHSEFGKQGVEVPYPRRDVFVINKETITGLT